MTDLNRQIKRRSNSLFDRARFVVMLEPGDVIGFRRERARKVYRITLPACYAMAVRAEVAAAKREKRKSK